MKTSRSNESSSRFVRVRFPSPRSMSPACCRAQGLASVRARIVAWIGAASCAAASLLLAVSDVHRVDTQSDTYVTNDDASLMCPRVPASRVPHETLESHDDTNVCIAP
jgi:hypothetical protein